MKVGIIGLGLMGGSMALSLQNYKEITNIYGYDKNEKHCREAMELRLVEKIITFEEIKKCDIIFIATPVNAIIKINNDLKKTDATIIDLGSTKEEILYSIPESIRKNYILSHPMTGTEFSGPKASQKELYKNKIVVLCDIEHNDNVRLKIAKDIFNFLEMKIIVMNAIEHDRHASFISHLPHIISYSLANSVLNEEKKESILALAAGGFRDMSRLAKSSPDMWNDIFAQNRQNLLESISIFSEQLQFAKNLIENNDWHSLHKWMAEANKLHKII